MKFSALTLPLAALSALTPALARIANFSFPSTAYLGENLLVNVTTEIYVQQWSDLNVMFGFQSKAYRCGTCVGQGEWYENLYGNSDYTGTNGTELASYTISVPVAPYLNTSLEYVLVAAVPYIAGASGTTGIRYFNQTITLTPNSNDGGAVEEDDSA
ncbi:uncharacterized protein MKK02DRAFT_42993 [Dioszegia hungarica]|uniref:Uncharacterized protein n=1 Tax=Dioszegia hungarica TaxID=4972 RepID=A0AA38LWP2_9TREE|nr:uncharacterized protein MKK02DRAFT_42993 [Dioszegia hungarica]KAI9638595.1 hypothetical protein MKK02DRAFT_42993 [Dioszegia hungarica]